MPRKLRKPKARIDDDQRTEKIIAWLANDPSVEWCEFAPCFPSDEELAAHWKKHREAILKQYILKYPGTRPVAWWDHDAPEPRKLIGGVEFPEGYLVEKGAPGRAEWVEAVREDWKNPATYEASVTYLDRLGLLTEAERRALAGQFFPPTESRNWPGILIPTLSCYSKVEAEKLRFRYTIRFPAKD